VDALGAPHVGERPEKELIASFVHRIAALSPQLVTFNGSSFGIARWSTASCTDLPGGRHGELCTRFTCGASPELNKRE
jgi:hypothetical protein